ASVRPEPGSNSPRKFVTHFESDENLILIYAPQIIQPEDLNRFTSLSTLQARSNLTRCSVFKDQTLRFRRRRYVQQQLLYNITFYRTLQELFFKFFFDFLFQPSFPSAGFIIYHD
ncbi:hypothetical protein, partial [Paenibacillus albilobatus]|uniref:hypothetical protein n=1 Tax=Paenibacillus albilobatus TaxID=2716884 RepID=UPI001BB3ED69